MKLDVTLARQALECVMERRSLRTLYGEISANRISTVMVALKRVGAVERPDTVTYRPGPRAGEILGALKALTRDAEPTPAPAARLGYGPVHDTIEGFEAALKRKRNV